MMASSFWGKTPPRSLHSRIGYKPILHHLVDVAAAALRLQLKNARRLEREANILGVDSDRLARATAFLAGLHDLGIFSVSFQAKVPELWPAGRMIWIKTSAPMPGYMIPASVQIVDRTRAANASVDACESYGRKWVMGPEKAAYRGGC